MREDAIRTAIVAGYAILLPIALYYRIRSQSTGEKLDRRREGTFVLATLRPMAALFAAGWIAWLIDPKYMAWSAIELPKAAAGIGLLLWIASGVLWIWTFARLGKNLTDTVVTRKAHTLVTTGPYRLVRHPFYLSVTLHMLGACLVTGSWALAAAGTAFLAILVLRTNKEEEELVARFGESYRKLMATTPRFVPSLRGTPARLGLALAILTIAAYAKAPGLGFINVDDPGYVQDNPQVQAGLTKDNVRWAFTTTAQSNWHPLTWLSLMADTTLFGTSPAVYHVTNVALHLAATLLLFAFLLRATGAKFRSAAVAALFALHPLHVESVAWISERKDVLSATFWMLTLLAYVHYVQRRTLGRYLLVAVTMALGLLAKPMLVTLPLVMLLLDHWPLRRFASEPWKRVLLDKLPLFALSSLSSYATIKAQGDVAIRSLDFMPLPDRIANALISTVTYLAQTFWPVKLAAYYQQADPPPPIWHAAGAALAILAITAAAIRYARSEKWLVTGWGWYLVTLVPVIGIVQVGSQAHADRYTYIPLIGVFVVICWGAHALVTRKVPTATTVRAIGVATASGAVAALATLTYIQVGHWTSSITLFQHTVNVTKGNAVAHATLASALVKEGRVEEATAHLREALRAHRGYAELHFMRTRVAIGRGQIREAEFMVGLELDAHPKDVRTLVNAGLLNMKQDRYDEAIERFEEALAVDPDSVDAHMNLGSIRDAQGRLDEAIAHFEAAVRVAPNDPDAPRVLAALKAKKAGTP